ncbi:hypothetical protein ACOME3_004810 [Neoechinorhynchus agilis]
MNRAYGRDGVRDIDLEMKNVVLRGRMGNIHFIRFPTDVMPDFLRLCIEKHLHTLTLDVYVTGGGAYKFERDIIENMKLNWHKCDELSTLIRGIHYVASNFADECYYYEDMNEATEADDLESRGFEFENPYPYILVNAGSGVSVLLVESQYKYQRLTGSSIGGGTFLGLCRLLTGCETYEDAIRLAEAGNSQTIDKLVRDIYGGDYERFGLAGQVVASSFGNVASGSVTKPSKEDLARSVLVTILNNLTSIAHMTAVTQNVDKIIFVGSFLRLNELSPKQVSLAMGFWSSRQIKPIFLRHEGYLGAFGCLRKFVFDNGEPPALHETEPKTPRIGGNR